MKLRLLPLTVLFVFASFASISHAQASAFGSVPRADYDPGYASHPTPIIHRTVAQTLRQEYNPSGTNYGVLLQNLTSAAMEDTIDQLYFWGLLFAVACLGFETIYVYYLRRERRRRLWISSEIVAQVYNAYHHAREKALGAIAAHNELVKERDQVSTPQPPVITMERPVLATLPDVYRQPAVVADQRLSGPTVSISAATDDASSYVPPMPAASPTTPDFSSDGSDPSSEGATSGVDSRQPSNLEQAQRQITALQNKLKNTRQALNLRIDEVRSLKEQMGQEN